MVKNSKEITEELKINEPPEDVKRKMLKFFMRTSVPRLLEQEGFSVERSD